MTEPEVTTTPETPEPLIQITSLDQFVGIMTLWHRQQVEATKHLLHVPVGGAFEVDGETIELSGMTRKGFMLGVEMALMNLGELPFEVPAVVPQADPV